MPTFPIDDVRETFTTDVSSLLGRVEDERAVLLGLPLAGGRSRGGEASRDRGAAAFQLSPSLGHAIGGTSSLVGADSLAESAQALELWPCRATRRSANPLATWRKRAGQPTSARRGRRHVDACSR